MIKEDLHSFRSSRRQHGLGLMELMVALVVTLVAVGAMVVLMANTLGSSSTTIRMSRLSQEMRAAMQVISRDLRRANYHTGYIACLANSNCRADLGIDAHVGTININGSGNCVWYWLDRDADGDLTDDATGAFRLASVSGVGAIQIRSTGNTAANCESDSGWATITDPTVVDITAFTVSDAQSYVETVAAGGVQQNVEKIELTIAGRLVKHPEIARQIDDLILVRNLTQGP